MSLFCLLYIPLLYFLRRWPSAGGWPSAEREGVWGLPLGAVAVAARHLFGPLAPPGGFGFSRWLSGFFEIVSLPVIISFALCALLVKLRTLPADVSYADFALQYLIPLAAYRSVNWISPGHPEFLVVVPVLWTAQAVGIPFFFGLVAKNTRWYVLFVLSLGVSLLPVAAATAWWAFYCQRPIVGLVLLFVSIIPAAVSVILDFSRHKEGNRNKIWN